MSLFFFLFPIFLIPELFFLGDKENQSISTTSMSIAYQNMISIAEIIFPVFFVIWIAGVIVASLRFLYVYRRFQKKLKKNIMPISKKGMAQYLLHKNMKQMNIKASIEIVYCRMNMSPVLIGTFKPKIVLPLHEIPYDELNMIIQHELTHFKKKDLWIKKMMLLAMIIHWYNPFIYLLQKEINKWSELSCDEDVVREMSRAKRKKYGEVILNMIYQANQDTNAYFLGSFFATRQTNLKKRLMKILEAKKTSKFILILSAAILVAIGSVGEVNADFVHKKIYTLSEEVLLEVNKDTAVDSLGNKAQKEEGYSELHSIKKSDESKFSEEDWEEILKILTQKLRL